MKKRREGSVRRESGESSQGGESDCLTAGVKDRVDGPKEDVADDLKNPVSGVTRTSEKVRSHPSIDSDVLPDDAGHTQVGLQVARKSALRVYVPDTSLSRTPFAVRPRFKSVARVIQLHPSVRKGEKAHISREWCT